MEQLTKSKIKIGGKDFPVKLNNEEQKNLKTIESEIADKIKNFQRNYSNISMQDILAMICIEQAFTIHNNKNSNVNAVEDVLKKIELTLAE